MESIVSSEFSGSDVSVLTVVSAAGDGVDDFADAMAFANEADSFDVLLFAAHPLNSRASNNMRAVRRRLIFIPFFTLLIYTRSLPLQLHVIGIS